jgi:hypothetical protein
MAGETMGIKLGPIVCFAQPMDKAQEELETHSKVSRRIPNKREKISAFWSEGVCERDGEE